MIHIAYCLDDGFAEPTCVSMASVLANTRSEVLFHIVYSKLSEENKSKFEQLCIDFVHGKCLFYPMDIDQYLPKLILQKNIHTTVATYFRLFLYLIIKNTNRLIYIDGDTVINDDIQKLWDENLQGRAIGAVKDITLRNVKVSSQIMDFDVEKSYFNAGMLLIDLERYSRVFNIDFVLKELERLYLRFAQANIVWLADQDILNYIANGRAELCLLHAKYNFMQNDFDKYNNYIFYAQNCSTLEEWIEANTNPVIIHYNGLYKPWNLNRRIRYSLNDDLFFHYKSLTPYKNKYDKLVMEEYKRRRRLTKAEALMEPKAFISMFWTDMLNDAAQITKQRVEGRKIALWGVSKHIKHVISIFALNDLMPAVLIDGFEEKQGQRIFEYTVESSQRLLDCKNDYFVVLSMETIRGRNAVLKLLKENGYTEQDFVVAYQEAFDFMEAQLV